MTVIDMYAPNVFKKFHDGPAALRTIQPTLELAKAVLDAEVERAGKPPLKWEHLFGGAQASPDGPISYEVIRVQVDITVDFVVKARMEESRKHWEMVDEALKAKRG